MSDHSIVKPVVSNKPYSIPIEMRPLWRISLLIASIATLGGEKRYLSVKKANMWDEYEIY
ncbi:hypothetical protein BOW53_13975 [Solemya pervernicosa gill symbiont]|uniref:Uncharacterized protein n=1 Tax=Solemya pervernicosa gill symbiont TaxID=642797 RepID=A0A1T2L1H0_9GAMM|nr:hypothetical protein BOW53_13975 [Solemya pervernicosa gill symbiont]